MTSCLVFCSVVQYLLSWLHKPFNKVFRIGKYTGSIYFFVIFLPTDILAPFKIKYLIGFKLTMAATIPSWHNTSLQTDSAPDIGIIREAVFHFVSLNSTWVVPQGNIFGKYLCKYSFFALIALASLHKGFPGPSSLRFPSHFLSSIIRGLSVVLPHLECNGRHCNYAFPFPKVPF